MLWLSTRIGASVRKRHRNLEAGEREDFGVVMAASLTLLGLITGFSSSLAISRCDQRENLEEAEANAIGTEFVRADFLPPADAAIVRTLLKNYVDQRILFFETRDDDQLRQINADTARLQANLWTVVLAAAAAKPTPVTAVENYSVSRSAAYCVHLVLSHSGH